MVVVFCVVLGFRKPLKSKGLVRNLELQFEFAKWITSNSNKCVTMRSLCLTAAYQVSWRLVPKDVNAQNRSTGLVRLTFGRKFCLDKSDATADQWFGYSQTGMGR
mmetsp:Transcript_1428/g.3279  ORF Transcript_1428/g.3279 Transcript_1428/m.3279 type:complete len:105 (-) Transcript_1428:72-386(-)